jgi:hypothetical protein
MFTLPRVSRRSGFAVLTATLVLTFPSLGFGQINRGIGGGLGNLGGLGGNLGGLGGAGGGFGSQIGGVGLPARMVNPNLPGGDRMYQYSSSTGSGLLQGPLIIQSQFGGAGGIGGQNYAGGGGTYGGAGFNGGLGGFGGGGGGNLGTTGSYSMFPPGFQLHFAYNTLVGLPSQQGQLGGGFGGPPPAVGGGFGGGFGFPGGGFGGGFGFPGNFGGGFPGKFGFGNGGYGY